MTNSWVTKLLQPRSLDDQGDMGSASASPRIPITDAQLGDTGATDAAVGTSPPATVRRKSLSMAKFRARTLHPSLQAALTLQSINDSTFGKVPTDQLAKELLTQCQRITDGDSGRIDALLATQAFTLDAIFNELTRLAAGREEIGQISRLLNLALKTQGECRATLKDLSGAKNPFANAYIRQQNVAFNQQVRNADGHAQRFLDRTGREGPEVADKHSWTGHPAEGTP